MTQMSFRMIITFLAGIFVFCGGNLPLGESIATAEEVKQAGNQTEEKQEFPRLDGVYRTSRQSTLIGRENHEYYDYVVFTKEGVAYTITGGYVPPNRFYLEQPSGNPPGAFQMKSVPLDDQPAFILKWVADPQEKQPFNGKYEVTDGVIRFTIKRPADIRTPAVTSSYQGQAAGSRLILVESWTAGDRMGTNQFIYEFKNIDQ